VATDVAARGIDLANLDLVIHADLPNDAEVMQHRSGRTGRAGRKGVSVLLVPPARRRRAEMLLNLAGIEAIWGTAPQADEIRKLDHERMLHDALFSEETTPDDLALAQALLAERSPEDIAAALARLYRARLPSPEDILDPGEKSARPRDDRSRDKGARGDDRSAEPRPRPGKSSPRRGMGEATVWFRAAIGRKKNAEARWLLPMICRRGGIDKNDIGAIKISDTTTEFEISERVADAFAASIRRPDKEDNIRIEPLTGAPQHQPASDKRPRPPRREADDSDPRARRNDNPRDESAPKHRGKPHRDGGSQSTSEPAFGKAKKNRTFEQARKPSFGKGSSGKAGDGMAPRKKRRD
jgi:ATP-dependent RNA helicase DeaD